ncbi:MAG: phosphoesterase PA-phosphatase [Candidatus Altiarchaeales archaeon HGW-Altiarchaeales-2]|nr:MAG: phosphoesterase PA-phosphatase [Candidatus Altiarchaeales archaeon HGW-Altiarchaeales-2]
MNEEFKHTFAEFISKITMAPLLAIPAFFILNFVFLHGLDTNFAGIEFICLLFGTILPIASMIIAVELKKRKNENTEYDLPNKEDRVIPYILAIISYLTGTIILYFFNAPLLTIGLMFCYFSNTLLAFLINFFWKISAHSIGVTGPATALVFAFGYIGFIYALILPFVMWSRIYLKKHTLLQVITGALLGFVLTAVQLWILFGA